MDDRGLVASCAFVTSLSLAACQGGTVAVAYGDHVQTFALNSSNGQLQSEAGIDFGQQVSALAILELPSDTTQVWVWA